MILFVWELVYAYGLVTGLVKYFCHSLGVVGWGGVGVRGVGHVRIHVKLHTLWMLRCRFGVGWGGVGHVRIHVKLHTLWMLCSSQRQCFNLDSEDAAKAGVKKGCVNASVSL